jgi:hypothetical protein
VLHRPGLLGLAFHVAVGLELADRVRQERRELAPVDRRPAARPERLHRGEALGHLGLLLDLLRVLARSQVRGCLLLDSFARQLRLLARLLQARGQLGHALGGRDGVRHVVALLLATEQPEHQSKQDG